MKRFFIGILPCLIIFPNLPVPANATESPKYFSEGSLPNHARKENSLMSMESTVKENENETLDVEEGAKDYEQIAALRTWTSQQRRLYHLAAPLLIKNTDLCVQDARYILGFTAKTKYSYSNELAGITPLALGLGEHLRVMNVLPGSGAEQSGLRVGDILVEIEGHLLPYGSDAENQAAALVGDLIGARPRLQSPHMLLSVLSSGKRKDMLIPLTSACPFSVELGNTDEINSFTDGYRVMVTQGLLNTAPTDQELTYILAREFAHCIIIQSRKKDVAAAIDLLRMPGKRSLAQTAVDVDSFSSKLDSTVDTLSLYLLARAGYDIDRALEFWKRSAEQFTLENREDSIAHKPLIASHFSTLAQAVQTIKDKQNKGQLLIP